MGRFTFPSVRLFLKMSQEVAEFQEKHIVASYKYKYFRNGICDEYFCCLRYFAPEKISRITYLERCSLCGNKHNWCTAVFMAGLLITVKYVIKEKELP